MYMQYVIGSFSPYVVATMSLCVLCTTRPNENISITLAIDSLWKRATIIHSKERENKLREWTKKNKNGGSYFVFLFCWCCCCFSIERYAIHYILLNWFECVCVWVYFCIRFCLLFLLLLIYYCCNKFIVFDVLVVGWLVAVVDGVVVAFFSGGGTRLETKSYVLFFKSCVCLDSDNAFLSTRFENSALWT